MPASRMRRPSGRASERQPEYFIACRIARSDPSYGPIARLRVIADGRRRQRAHCPDARLRTLHDGRGSPHDAQTGGTNAGTASQQEQQTGPRVG